MLELRNVSKRFSGIAAEICLWGFRKIPFACSYLPGKTPVHMVILGAVGIMYLAVLSAKFEKEALLDARGIGWMLAVFAMAVLAARVVSIVARPDTEEPDFEETVAPAVMELGLHRDGALHIADPE